MRYYDGYRLEVLLPVYFEVLLQVSFRARLAIIIIISLIILIICDYYNLVIIVIIKAIFSNIAALLKWVSGDLFWALRKQIHPLVAS